MALYHCYVPYHFSFKTSNAFVRQLTNDRSELLVREARLDVFKQWSVDGGHDIGGRISDVKFVQVIIVTTVNAKVNRPNDNRGCN